MGVLGESDNRGAGVHGHNKGNVAREDNGHGCPGVFGESDLGYGGVFAGSFAQLASSRRRRRRPGLATRRKQGRANSSSITGAFCFIAMADRRLAGRRFAGGSLLSEFFSGVIGLFGVYFGEGLGTPERSQSGQPDGRPVRHFSTPSACSCVPRPTSQRWNSAGTIANSAFGASDLKPLLHQPSNRFGP